MKKLGLLFIFFLMLAIPVFANGNQERSSGDGKNISITIKVLTADRLPSGLANAHILAYQRLITNFRTYSGIFVRQDIDFDSSLYREILSGYYSDSDAAGSDLGNLTMTDYLMTGSITQSPLGYHVYLQIAKTAANDKSVAFSFSQHCTFSDLIDLSIVNRASLDLLEQMGVQLTERARTELAGADAANRARGRTIMLEADAAQKAGDDARARFLLNQAAELDAQLAEEAQRRLSEMGKPLAMLTTEIIPSPALLPPAQMQNFIPTPERQIPPPARTTGNLGQDARARQQAYEIEQENERIRKEIEAENVRIRAENERRKREVEAENERRKREVEAENVRRQAAVAAENAARDAHNKSIWVKALADSEAYYRNYLGTVEPFELVYENKIDELPETHNFINKTLSVKFNTALVPVESRWAFAVENDVNKLRSQLLATGKAEAWGLNNWPKTSVSNTSPFIDRTGRIDVNAELLDDKGKVLGSQSFSFLWSFSASFNDKGLTFNIDEDNLSSQSVIFNNVNIDDITDTLQIRIVRINGRDAEEAAVQGGVQFSTDYRKWTRLERGRQRREAQIAAQTQAKEAAAATGKFLFNYLLPHYVGVGTTAAFDGTDRIFTTPSLVLSAYNGHFLGGAYYFGYGCDFGLLHGSLDVVKDVNYYSFYPNAHIGFGMEFIDGGLFMALGGGCMWATYAFPNDEVNIINPVLDFVFGARYNFFDFSISYRSTGHIDGFESIRTNLKIQFGFRFIPYL